MFNRQGGGSFLAYQRYKAGTSTAFSAGLGDEDGGCPEGTYTAYDEENGGQYSEPPFSDGGAAGKCTCIFNIVIVRIGFPQDPS